MNLVLTTDELRVTAAVHGRRPPTLLDGGWSTEDIPVADVVALRGLLARGLVTAVGADVRPIGELSGAVLPMLTARTLVEVRRDGVDRPGRRLIASTVDSVVSCAEDRPDLWHIETGQPDQLERLLTELTDHLPDAAPPEEAVTVPTDLLVEAERRTTSTDTAHLPAVLAARGLRRDAADVLARVLRDLRAMVTVRSAHRDGPAARCAAVTWLETVAAGVWLVMPVDDPRADEDTEALAGHTELRPADRSGVRAELTAVLDELTPRSHR